MVLTTSGLKKRVKKRPIPVGAIKKRLPVGGAVGTIGKGKPSLPGKGGAAGTAGKVTRPVVGGATGTIRKVGKKKPVTPKVRPVVGGAPKPGAGNKRAIAVKKKALAAKRTNKLANQKRLAARKRALAKKRTKV